MATPAIYRRLALNLKGSVHRNAGLAVIALIAPFVLVLAASALAPTLSPVSLALVFLMAPIWIWLWGCVLVAQWFYGPPPASLPQRVIDWLKALFLGVWFVFPVLLVIGWLSWLD